MSAPSSAAPLGLKAYTKDTPPGWRPHSYPISEYRDLLMIWCKLTRLDPEQVGAAIMSRLEGSAHRLARQLAIVRQEMDAGGNVIAVTYRGIDAVSLLKLDAVIDPGSGAELIPGYDSGAKVLIDKLLSLNHLDDQDRAWVSLDQFLGFRRPSGMTFIEYLTEWDRLYEDATLYANLGMNDIGKCFLFFSQSNIDSKDLDDLRMKVNGDLSRFEEMVAIMLRLSKNEMAIQDQKQGYRLTGGSHWVADDWHGWLYHEDGIYYDSYGTAIGDEETYFDDLEYDEYDYDFEDYDLYDDYEGYDDYYDDLDHGDNQDDDWHDDGSGGEAFKGFKKGKGKGKGFGKKPSGDQCTKCGSKWHSTPNCPMPEDEKEHHADAPA